MRRATPFTEPRSPPYPQTYKNLPDWYKELREYRPGIPVVCIANKIDVDMKVTQKEFGFPKKHNLQVRTHAHRLASRPTRRARLANRPLWPAAHAGMHVRAVLLLFGLRRHQRRRGLRSGDRPRDRILAEAGRGLCGPGDAAARRRHLQALCGRVSAAEGRGACAGFVCGRTGHVGWRAPVCPRPSRARPFLTSISALVPPNFRGERYVPWFSRACACVVLSAAL